MANTVDAESQQPSGQGSMSMAAFRELMELNLSRFSAAATRERQLLEVTDSLYNHCTSFANATANANEEDGVLMTGLRLSELLAVRAKTSSLMIGISGRNRRDSPSTDDWLVITLF
ncbi:MAG: hypothetical protein AB7F43_15450 [Bacteriovoracia bacterium]